MTRLEALDAVARQEEAALADLERWLRDRIREELGLPSRPSRSDFNLVEHARKHRIEPSYELARRENSQRIRSLQTLYLSEDLDSRLARIASDARLAEQETGLSTLFLAFGFLRWYDSASSDTPNFAPLLLLQVNLRKRPVNRKAIYSIRAAAEVPEINLSLRERLLRDPLDVARELPEFDEENDSVESYFDKVRDAIEGLPRARIERYLTLGHFSFGRLAMHADLDPKNWVQHPVAHTILHDLMRGSEAEGGGSILFASDYDLDDEAVENTAPILVNDADASQHSGIVDVMKGKSLVIEGPPGTGKSQTITNIIANALYAGKSVLFLAEKLAALQVVKDRLDTAGLGEFCLELHSDKTHPRGVVENLKQRIELGQDRPKEPPWNDDLQRLRGSRGRVRQYLSALHEPDGQDNKSAFSLFWSAIAARRNLGHEFELVRRVDIGGVFARDTEFIESCGNKLGLLATAVQSFEERHGPFNACAWSKTNYSFHRDADHQAVSDAVRDVHDTARKLLTLGGDKATELRIDVPKFPTALREWLDAITGVPEVPADPLLPRLGSFNRIQLAEAAELASKRFDLEKHIDPDVPRLDSDAVQKLGREIADLGCADASPVEISERVRIMAATQQALTEGLKFFASLIKPFRPTFEPTVVTAEGMAKTVLLASSIPTALDRLLAFEGQDELILAEGGRRAAELAAKDAELRSRFQTAGPWPPVKSMRAAHEVAATSGLRRIGAAVSGRKRQANRILASLGCTLDTPAIETNLVDLIAYLDTRAAFVSDNRLASVAASYWSGLDTPFEELAAVVSLRGQFQRSAAGLGGMTGSVRASLFSTNTKIVEVLRLYQSWADAFLAALKAWPESCREIVLSDAASIVSQRSARLHEVSGQCDRLAIRHLSIGFERILREAERRNRVRALDRDIQAHAVFAVIGADFCLSAKNVDSLQQISRFATALASVSPPADVRARLHERDGHLFRIGLASAAADLHSALASYQKACVALTGLGSAFGSRRDYSLEDLISQLAPLVSAIPCLGEWLDVAARRANVAADGLAPLIEAFEQEESSLEHLADTFRAMVFHHRAIRAKAKRPVLRDMRALDLESERQRFVATDETLKRRQREAVRARLLGRNIPAGNGIGDKKSWTDLHCLRNEFTKQTRHLPIRTLLLRARNAIQIMQPCFMMSPLSLAKFVPAQALSFDLVVIDEASQMKPEDALGGLLRTKQIVVVGDPNQLPPTDFFARIAPVEGDSTDPDSEPDDIDAESILDWSLKTYHAPRRLKWHYRSRCESLIAFSNREFYSSRPGSPGDLITFPNAKPGAFSVDLVRTPGPYKASRNPEEVRRVVEATIDFMTRHADLPAEEIPTLGIVAINIEQKEAIREEFNRCGRGEAIPEPFFVKNLENVQGDERDVIMISLTYGPEEGQTRVAQRFGPIGRSQGHRRLNVLFTRARRRVVLFSSMGSEDVLVSPTTKRGVRVLRDYLRYAESRRLEVGNPTGGDFDSDFEREVRARLEQHSFKVDIQVGVAGYRIDLGVRHPEHPSVYLAGIECDGAAFHSTKSARDRDRLRESVLRGLGWNILRVWSTDWFANAELQTERLVTELTRLAARPVVSDTFWVVDPNQRLTLPVEGDNVVELSRSVG